jgi:hypothetical protein
LKLREKMRSPHAASAETMVSPSYAGYASPFHVNLNLRPRSMTSPGWRPRRMDMECLEILGSEGVNR